MKLSIVTLSTLLSLALASPAGVDKREPIVCIGCVNSKDCNPPCFMVGQTSSGAGGECKCPDPNAGGGCPDGCGPAGSACYTEDDAKDLCECGTYCEDNGLGTCGDDKICTGSD
ncbi:hypothetical protein ACHAPJ_012528 [Fusarium lateritium]